MIKHLRWFTSLVCLMLLMDPAVAASQGTASELRAGAFAQDITPKRFPVIVNGHFTSRTATEAHDPLHARCLVLEQGPTRLAIVIVDSCMVPRSVADRAKALARAATGIRTDHVLISATHTHSAPSLMDRCLGTDRDPAYTDALPGMIAEGIARAAERLEPAEVGWTVVDDHRHTYNRRWIRRPDRLLSDPFGQPTGRAHMHPGYQSPDVIGPSGPVDPALTLLAIRSTRGQPLALLANYSMHYKASPIISADYFGAFATQFAARVREDHPGAPFVAAMSQGTSGDLMSMDYGRAPREVSLQDYAGQLTEVAWNAYRQIDYRAGLELQMVQRKLPLKRRVPDAERLAWARQVVESLKGRQRKSIPEIYADQQLVLHAQPTVELKLQAIRIGDFAIAAMPNEVFAITGLKLKRLSPLQPLMVIELANGAEGYIPPPEQHALGGYVTWPATTAGLEVQAEPRIVETLVTMLEELSGKQRLNPAEPRGEYVQAALASKPLAYWRMSTIAGWRAADISGHEHHGRYEPGVAYYLPGPDSARFSREEINRAVHFAGGRMRADLPQLTDRYSVQFWFYNGLRHDVRAVTGYLVSHGEDRAEGAPGLHLGIGGTHDQQLTGRLFLFNGNAAADVVAGETTVGLRKWHHVTMVRDANRLQVYLDGKLEIDGSMTAGATRQQPLFLGGRNDSFANFEGKIDEAAVYDRPLTADEIGRHLRAAGVGD